MMILAVYFFFLLFVNRLHESCKVCVLMLLLSQCSPSLTCCSCPRLSQICLWRIVIANRHRVSVTPLVVQAYNCSLPASTRRQASDSHPLTNSLSRSDQTSALRDRMNTCLLYVDFWFVADYNIESKESI